MHPAAAIAAPLILATVLVLSALGKLRAPEVAHQAFEAFGVPEALRSRFAVRAHPWVELFLAGGLLLGPSWARSLAALATLALMTIYLGLVWRANRSEVDVNCACFGEADGIVTTRTVWRNVWLVLLSVIASWTALEGPSVATRIRQAETFWWVVALAGVALTAWLVARPREEVDSVVTPAAAHGEENELDYARSRIPHVPVTLGDGSQISLIALPAQRAQVILSVSRGCSPCTETMARMPAWQEQVPEVDLRLLFREEPPRAEGDSDLYDPAGYVSTALALIQTPSAVLLGADGLLAGGPVYGLADVDDFITQIRGQLEASRGIDPTE